VGEPPAKRVHSRRVSRAKGSLRLRAVELMNNGYLAGAALLPDEALVSFANEVSDDPPRRLFIAPRRSRPPRLKRGTITEFLNPRRLELAWRENAEPSAISLSFSLSL